MFQSTQTVKQLFWANIAIFIIGTLLQIINFPFYQIFALYPNQGFMIHQLITHQFLHGGIFHLLFNMLALVSIGPSVEDYLGRNKFILYYLLSGLGAAGLHILMTNSNVPMVGASGAIYGVLLMFTILNPNEKLYFFGFIGLKSKYLTSVLFAIEIILGFTSTGDGIGHFAHVGGGIMGIILIIMDKYLPKKRKARWT